jgi:hypothetical protein
VELAKVRALGLSAPDLRAVLGGNFLRLTARVRDKTTIAGQPVGGSDDGRRDPWQQMDRGSRTAVRALR